MAGKGKGSDTGKVGRPDMFGAAQLAHVDSRQCHYNAKRNDKKSTQADMTKFLNDEVFRFFAKFGWNDPERSVPQDSVEPDPEVIETRRREAAIAKLQAKGENALEVFKKQDELVQHVRSLMSARFTRIYKSVANGTTINQRSGTNIHKLLLSYMDKPSLKHLHQVYAKSCPDLDAEVDQRLPGVRLQKGDPEYKRIGLWNTVAAERYAQASEKEKEETLTKAKEILSEERKKWQDGLAEPQTMEEAIAFMLASQSFLEDLMQFFADRCGGMAVMILAGAGEIMMAEGACDIPGKPKILYTDIEGERAMVQGFAGRVHTQACLVTESRWGVRLSDGTRTASPIVQSISEDICVNTADQAPPTSPQVLSGDDAPPGFLTQAESEFVSDHTSEARSTSFPESGKRASPMPNAQDSDALISTNDQQQDHVRVESHDSCSSGIQSNVDKSTSRASEPKPKPKPRPRPVPRTRVSPSVTADVIPSALTLIDAGGVDVRTERPDGNGGDVSKSSTKDPVPEGAQGSDDDEARRRVARVRAGEGQRENVMPTPGEVTDERELSAFAFQPSGVDDIYWDETNFQKDCSADGAMIEERKKWFIQCGMKNFLSAVPAKLKGKVHLGIACDVVRAYMKLELSNASEDILDLGRYRIDGQSRPGYTADLQKKATSTKATWNKMVEVGVNRTPARLDLDVGTSLERQWVQQQPEVRRNCAGVLTCAADVSMDWEGRLTPGAHGVRLLMLTLLCWGSTLSDSAGRQKEAWGRLARDFADVFNVLAVQAGVYKATEAEPSTVQGEGGKRKKKATEKAAWMQEEQTTKNSGRKI